MMKGTKRTIILGALIAVIWDVLLYFNDPNNHFVTYLYRKAKPLLDKIEDDDVK